MDCVLGGEGVYSLCGAVAADQPTLMVMDTEGHIRVFSLPELKPLYKAWCLDGADAV